MTQLKQQGSILLMTLLLLAVVMAIIASIALSTRLRIHAAHEQSQRQQMLALEHDGFSWAMGCVLHLNDQSTWPLSHRIGNSETHTQIWVQPLQSHLNANAWLQAGPLSPVLLDSWPFIGGDANARALSKVILARRQRMGLDHSVQKSSLSKQSQRWLDWRADLSRQSWLALQPVMTAYPQADAGIHMDPRLLSESFLNGLGVSEADQASWSHCLMASKEADSFKRAKGCATGIAVLASLSPSWEKPSVFVITVVTIRGDKHRAVQWCVRVSRHGKKWRWAVLWRHVGLAQSLFKGPL